MIKFINVNKIHHHPDNPRKDLGDLTELAESIKQSGILQNLTIVPWYSQITGVGCDDPKQQEEMGYYAVIGNRRLAAAKLAGLEEAPCVISDMDHKTQVATMLLENMQRSDLTAYEQAQGFQMMLDLGESVAGISEKTGLSKSTVRSRMKLLELDQDKLKETIQRGATLMDYMELEKIESIELKNKVLEKIGTDDFNWSLRSAIAQEKEEKQLNELILEIQKFAVETEDTFGLSYKNAYRGSCKIEIPEDIEKVQYFYKLQYGYVYLYYKNPEEEQNKEKEERERKEQLRQAKYSKLDDMSKRAYQLRSDFIKKLSNTKARKNIETVIENTLYAIIESYYSLDYEEMADIMDIDISDKEDIEWKDIAGHIWKQPELYLLTATYYMLDSDRHKYFDWDCTYSPNEDLDYVYNFLEKLGYKMSEEEQALQNGTHELFKTEEE